MSTESKAKNPSVTHSLNPSNFKPWASPRRKAGLRDDQLAISTHSITLPVSVATRLGDKVGVLWSDADKAIAIQKAADGDYKLRQVGKNKTSRSLYCKTLLDVKKVKKGRYMTQFDEKSQMLIARVA
ncbi:MAG: hypothetical protein ACREBU_09500 [Nitrososphaera sp.]